MSKYNQYVPKQKDWEFKIVVEKLNSGDWSVHPSFQRPFVWKRAQWNRLIESALKNYALPSFFAFTEIVDGERKMFFSDGQQRLTVLRKFMNDDFAFRSDNPMFKHLDGKKFSQFPKEDRWIVEETTIKIESWPDGTPRYIIKDHYDYLNTNGSPLSYGHIMRNRYEGEHYSFLQSLTNDKKYLNIIGSKSNPDNKKKLEHEVLVWTYAANLMNKTYHETLNYKGNCRAEGGVIETFLNHYIEHPEEFTDDYKNDLTKKFNKAVKISNALFGKKAFCKPCIKNNVWELDDKGCKKYGSFNNGIYEVLMYLFTFADEESIFSRLETVRSAYHDGIKNDVNLQYALWHATTSDEATSERFKKFYNIFLAAGVKFNW